ALLNVCDVQHAVNRSIEARSMTRSNLKFVTSNGYLRLSTSWSVSAARQLCHSSPLCFFCPCCWLFIGGVWCLPGRVVTFCPWASPLDLSLELTLTPKSNFVTSKKSL